MITALKARNLAMKNGKDSYDADVLVLQDRLVTAITDAAQAGQFQASLGFAQIDKLEDVLAPFWQLGYSITTVIEDGTLGYNLIRFPIARVTVKWED